MEKENDQIPDRVKESEIIFSKLDGLREDLKIVRERLSEEVHRILGSVPDAKISSEILKTNNLSDDNTSIVSLINNQLNQIQDTKDEIMGLVLQLNNF